MKCPECNTEMKALFVGEYCPNDCDRPEVLAKRKYEAEAKKLSETKKADGLEFWLPGLRPWTNFKVPYKPATPNKINYAAIKKAHSDALQYQTATTKSIDKMLKERWVRSYLGRWDPPAESDSDWGD